MDRELAAFLSGVIAFMMSWLVQPHFRSLGFLSEIVDHPGHRRPHREPVPRTGGMAIFISFFCALFFLEQWVLKTPLPWSWLSGPGKSIHHTKWKPRNRSLSYKASFEQFAI